MRSLPGQMREVLESGGVDDPSVARLFPSAYPGDPQRDEEYRLLVHDELRQSLLGALDTLEATADQTELDEEQLLGWMRAINEVRLLLGTRLDVTEDQTSRRVPDEDPRAPALALYGWLSWLQEQVVEALAD